MNDIVSSALPAAKSPRPVTGISAPLNFIRRQDKRPVFHSSALTGGKPKYFYDTEAHSVTISDMREIVDDLSVDRQGFELRCRLAHLVGFCFGQPDFQIEPRGLAGNRIGIGIGDAPFLG